MDEEGGFIIQLVVLRRRDWDWTGQKWLEKRKKIKDELAVVTNDRHDGRVEMWS
jgi:hypothetical protein